VEAGEAGEAVVGPSDYTGCSWHRAATPGGGGRGPPAMVAGRWWLAAGWWLLGGGRLTDDEAVAGPQKGRHWVAGWRGGSGL
jgi:hypothetical protein